MPVGVKSVEVEEKVTVLALLESAPLAVVAVDARGEIVLVNAKAEEIFGYARRELLGQPLEMLLPARFRQTHRHHRDDYIKAPRARPMGLGMDLAGQRKDGSEFPVEIGLSSVQVGGDWWAVSFITDITERVAAAEALRSHAQDLEERVATRTRELERRQRVAEGLRDILAILNTARPLEAILEAIVAQASQLLAPDAAAIYRQDGADQSLQMQTAETVDGSAGQEDEAVPAIVNQALQEDRPVTLNDTAFRDSVAHSSEYRAVLAVPLNVKGDVYGSICLYYRQSKSFTQEEKALAVAFADQAALAIENARLQEQVERSAVAAERSRLARDLHDAVTQTLFSTSLIAEVLPRLWQVNPEEAERRLDELRELTRGALAEMRTLLLELRPTALAEAKLGKLLQQLAEAVTGRARLPVQVQIEGEESIPDPVKVAYYRIAQEALNNVAKHAGASKAAVTLTYQPGGVVLVVWDNGRGFDQEAVPPAHLGLRIMQERAESIGADLTIESERGSGTEVSVRWRAGS